MKTACLGISLCVLALCLSCSGPRGGADCLCDGDLPLSSSCSDPLWTTQEECEEGQCSNPNFLNQPSCESAGHEWAPRASWTTEEWYTPVARQACEEAGHQWVQPSGAPCSEDSPLSDPVLGAEPSRIDFGYLAPLNFSANEEVTLINSGGGELELQSLEISNDDGASAFELYGVPAELPLVLGPGEFENIELYFAPPSASNFVGSLYAVTDAGMLSVVSLGGCSSSPDCVVEF